MKKCIKAFLTVQKILAIIGVVLLALTTVIALIVGIVVVIKNIDEISRIAQSGTTPTDREMEEIILPLGIAFGLASGCFIGLLVEIVSLVLSCVAKGGFKKAQNKSEAKKYGVMSIIAGVLSEGFGIPAGIMILCSKDEMYQDEKVVSEQ